MATNCAQFLCKQKSTNHLLPNSFETKSCENSLVDFCTSALLKALRINLLYSKKAFRSAEVWKSAREFSHGLSFRRPKSSEAKRRFLCTNLICRKIKTWRNAKMPSKMSENADIICVEHCEQKIFAVGSFPGTCSQCHINLKDCDLKIPPFSVPTPFSRWVSF